MLRVFPGHWFHTAFAAVVFACWWGGFYQTFFYEWWVNEQYSYGFIVPFLALYLAFLRLDSCPLADSTAGHRGWWVFPLGAALLLTPIDTILGANPEWRAALWLQAILTYGATLSLLGAIGGWGWVRHFALPLSLLLFAVPWPTSLEQPVVLGLMQLVTGVTVEALNMLGYFAQQEGNLIRLTSGQVGVEEACSGVRSFQSTLMAAYFLGELFRWKGRYRLALLIAGTTVSLFLNFIRTLILTLVAIRKGAEAMQDIHDPVGHFVSLGSFLLLFLFAWLLHRRYRKRTAISAPPTIAPPTPIKASTHSTLNPARLAMAPAVTMVVLTLLPYPFAAAWYNRGEPLPTERQLIAVNWSRFADEPKSTEIAPSVRAILRYTEGEQVSFRWQNQFWTGFFFRWEAGKISSHIAVHRPDVCLPSAGFQLIELGPPLVWREGNLLLEFSSQIYRYSGRDYYVFHAMWDTAASRRVPLASDWNDRLHNAWNGLRINERQSLQLVLVGPPNMPTAQDSLRRFLRTALSVSSP